MVISVKTGFFFSSSSFAVALRGEEEDEGEESVFCTLEFGGWLVVVVWLWPTAKTGMRRVTVKGQEGELYNPFFVINLSKVGDT